MNNNDLLETNKIDSTNQSIPNSLLFEPKTIVDTKVSTLYVNSKNRTTSLQYININSNGAKFFFINDSLFIILSEPYKEYIQDSIQIIFTQMSEKILDYLCIDENRD